jgi:hypothetical protein
MTPDLCTYLSSSNNKNTTTTTSATTNNNNNNNTLQYPLRNHTEVCTIREAVNSFVGKLESRNDLKILGEI